MRRRSSERGAVMVEMVLMIPIFLTIALAVFDIGLGFKASITISNGTRAGARVITSLGQSSGADKSALTSVAASLAGIPTNDLDVVVIYRTTTADGAVPSGCLTSSVRSAGGSSALKCNVYSAAEVRGAQTSTAFTGNCSTSRDRFYCPSTRVNTQALTSGPDYVGVYVRLNHTTRTKVFGSTLVLEDRAVMRVEPNAGL